MTDGRDDGRTEKGTRTESGVPFPLPVFPSSRLPVPYRLGVGDGGSDRRRFLND